LGGVWGCWGPLLLSIAPLSSNRGCRGQFDGMRGTRDLKDAGEKMVGS
jgi:hypothetical protein